jgi:hypothetical protein
MLWAWGLYKTRGNNCLKKKKEKKKKESQIESNQSQQLKMWTNETIFR